jgi:hypothetical protein
MEWGAMASLVESMKELQPRRPKLEPVGEYLNYNRSSLENLKNQGVVRKGTSLITFIIAFTA